MRRSSARSWFLQAAAYRSRRRRTSSSMLPGRVSAPRLASCFGASRSPVGMVGGGGGGGGAGGSVEGGSVGGGSAVDGGTVCGGSVVGGETDAGGSVRARSSSGSSLSLPGAGPRSGRASGRPRVGSLGGMGPSGSTFGAPATRVGAIVVVLVGGR